MSNMPDYKEIAEGLAELIIMKQLAYGDSFSKAGEVMRILYPTGIPVDQFEDSLTIVRVIDKLFRVANRKDAFGESPWRDIAGYALLSEGREEIKRQEHKEAQMIADLQEKLREIEVHKVDEGTNDAEQEDAVEAITKEDEAPIKKAFVPDPEPEPLVRMINSTTPPKDLVERALRGEKIAGMSVSQ